MLYIHSRLLIIALQIIKYCVNEAYIESDKKDGALLDNKTMRKYFLYPRYNSFVPVRQPTQNVDFV